MVWVVSVSSGCRLGLFGQGVPPSNLKVFLIPVHDFTVVFLNRLLIRMIGILVLFIVCRGSDSVGPAWLVEFCVLIVWLLLDVIFNF